MRKVSGGSLFQVIENVYQWFYWIAYWQESFVGAYKDTWPFDMGAVYDVVVFYGSGMEPETAKWIHRGVANDKSCFLRESKVFS